MEWIIGFFVLWVLWRLLTGTPRREATVKDAIGRAYIANTKQGQQWIKTPIYWEAAEQFAQDRGARLNNGSYHFRSNVNGEDVAVIFYHSVKNGTVNISVTREADLAAEIQQEVQDMIARGRKAIDQKRRKESDQKMY